MPRLTRTDLINWADTKQAEGMLPELVRRLILTSNSSIEEIVMPYGDSVGRSGLDGFVRAAAASTYIAAGESVWEMGKNADYTSKANGDFRKRTIGTADCRQQEQTYYCVTPRHWEKKADWQLNPGVANAKIVHHWKDVRVYDVDDLLGWLSTCPSVEAWFSRILGKPTAGVRDVDAYWKNIAATDAGIVSHAVLLGGRDELTKQAQSHLADPNELVKPMSISSRSPAEVVPFAVAATLASQDEKTIAKTLVVDSRSRWEQIIAEEFDLGLIIAPQVQPTREELQHAASQRHRVIYCSAPVANTQIKLPRLSEFEVRNRLVASGFNEGQAVQHAKHCGGNGQLLLDRLSGLQATARRFDPRLDDSVKVACLFLVAWDGEHAADREIFGMLSGRDYREIEASLAADSTDPDGLLFRADGKYRLISPELAWLQHSQLITKSSVENFADVVRYVLADDDPTAGMTGHERLTAQFLGKRPEFSSTLRRNMVHSLAIVSALGTTQLNLDVSLAPSFVNWIVDSVLKEADFRRWASFRDELSILAEAAPEAVLDALERGLQPGGSLHQVMEKTQTDLFSSPAHVGILWALERICWSTVYLERAVSILLRLASITPDTRSGNTPKQSIRETLQLHCPQTNAEWETRQRVITRMLEEDKEIAFDLVVSLFPTGYTSWMYREPPMWRHWADSYKQGATYHQTAIERRWCVDQLVSHVDDKPERWNTLFDLCGDIEDSQYEQILETYQSRLNAAAFDDDDRRSLWECLNALLVRIEWAAGLRKLEDGQIVDVTEVTSDQKTVGIHSPRDVHRESMFGAKLRELRDKMRPGDAVLAGCHAFLSGLGNNHCSRHFSDRFDYHEQQKRIAEARQAIARAVIDQQGFAGLQRLARIDHVDANAVGWAAATSGDAAQTNATEMLALLASEGEPDRLLASGFIAAWSWQYRDSLATEILPKYSTLPTEEVRAIFLRSLPFLPEIWEFVDAQDDTVQRLYWRSIQRWRIPEERLTYFAQRLIQARRADRAVDLLAHRRRHLSANEADLVFVSLEQLQNVVRDPEESKPESLRWEIQQLLEVLYDVGLAQVERLVRLELLFHNVFDDDADLSFQPKGLMIAIRDAPSFFVDLLTYSWKNDSGESEIPDTDITRALADRIGGLFYRLAELPGQSDLCPFNGHTTPEWVAEVLRVATERNYITAVQLQLAKVMTCQAWSNIESWPSPEIQEAINLLAEPDTECLRRQLTCGLGNARGVHWLDPTGQSERSQAKVLRRRANQVQMTCPSAAWALQNTAADLDLEAKQNVDRADWGG